VSFTTSAGVSDAVTRLIKCIGERTGFAFPVRAHMLRHGCGYALAPGESRIGSATSPSSTPTPRGLKRNLNCALIWNLWLPFRYSFGQSAAL
jgi:hypothetical protein